MNPAPIAQFSAKAVQDFMTRHRESEYCLIDVRERQEYEDAHIPGAQLIPLMRVLSEPSAIPRADHVIFYCRSGRRSMRAAQAFARFSSEGKLYNMMGGIMAWHGRVIPELPAVRLFDLAGSEEELLGRALELEKGAHAFYDAFAEQVKNSRLQRVIAAVLDAEDHHSREVYDMLVAARARHGKETKPFDELFAELPDNVLESGHTYDEVFRAATMNEDFEKTLLEVAVEVETHAFDLYRVVAERVSSPQAREAFLQLAHAEKHHAEFILRAIAGEIAAD